MSITTAISLLLGSLVGLVAYVFVPKPNTSYEVGDRTIEGGGKMNGLIAGLANEIYCALPKSFAEKMTTRPSNETELLLQKSGNPWNIKPGDFPLLQITSGVLGLITGFVMGLILSFTPVAIPIPAMILVAGVFGYFAPKLKYKSAAKQRDLDFKRQLPDALDLIIISLTAGQTFSAALRDALPQMKEGVLKDEFSEVSRSIDSGKTLHESLDNFAKKSPSDSITAFVRAVQEATELNMPLGAVFESRAEASRKEFFALLQQRTAALEPKMMGALVPTLIPGLLIIVIAPAVATLMTEFM